jgi:hypothetical protein
MHCKLLMKQIIPRVIESIWTFWTQTCVSENMCSSLQIFTCISPVLQHWTGLSYIIGYSQVRPLNGTKYPLAHLHVSYYCCTAKYPSPISPRFTCKLPCCNIDPNSISSRPIKQHVYQHTRNLHVMCRHAVRLVATVEQPKSQSWSTMPVMWTVFTQAQL